MQMQVKQSSIRLSTYWKIDRSPHPEFPVRVATIKDSSGMEAETDVPFWSGIAETCFDGVIYFPYISWIDQNNGRRIVRVRDSDVTTSNCLKMPIARGQFPIFDLLEKADHGDI